MTPAARVQTAIELLDEIIAGTPAEKALTGWARRARFAGSKDRAAVRDHVYDVLRQRRLASELGGGLTGRRLMIGLLRAQGADPSDLFTGHPYAPAPLEAGELEAGTASGQPDLPDWIAPPMQEALGADFEGNAQAMRARAPVFLRVNLRKASPEKALIALQEDGITAETSAISDTALLVTEGQRKINNSRAYREGLVELQDASSQAAVQALDLQDGTKVLDYCAGGGGKVLAMAGRCKGSFFAHDANHGRMRDLPDRAKRAGAKVRTLRTNDIPGQGPYDLVFCDVPCSGSGTWRRTPDAKWRFEQQDLDELNRVQFDILSEAARHVANEGRLAYATCSLLRVENHDVVNRFLAANPEWAVSFQKQWTLLDGCDGFFLTILSR
ncbi:RsmB/NOP family class I SAM-dependent RNA methyltransferase [Shimia sp. CNT1-13L.2]|uniref:RsmB/NOP family class I SAM-dependent RNA methyltransferase n=1 Tax=Shimia sp. CNT1-13L.2 TaxID=2959663 RepID=UPI0020CDD8C3|nr:RsmB/NOP family class I SAM-dependent RNA methyltransferase [Shimia sp. CNT1-13L.2]MCP9482152.1 RsmB/NOP family class I SAM-dependent RNA methyltransferase [Shimia sp. CNT1-13L.2]